MVEKVEELLLPNAVVQRIIKEALPDGINVAKDARAAISRAASIFVLYLSSTARDQLKTRKQKTLTPADVIQALEAMEMEHFVEPLKKAMDQYKHQQRNKKDKKQADNTTESTEPALEAEKYPNAQEETEVPLEDQETEIPDTEEMAMDHIDQEQTEQIEADEEK